eukprot:2172589-Rhodomonas_salina.1
MAGSQSESESDEEARRERWWSAWSGRPTDSDRARLPEPFDLKPHRSPSKSQSKSPRPRAPSPEPQDGLISSTGSMVSPRTLRRQGTLSAAARARVSGVMRTKAVDEFVQALKGGLRDSESDTSDVDIARPSRSKSYRGVISV